MNNRHIIFLLCTAALAYACGPWMHSQSENAASVTHSRKAVREVATTLNVIPDGHHVDFSLNVTNNTAKTVELRFPNGQTHDFMVLDRNGRIVWRWSDGRIFTQTMQSKTVASSNTVTLADDWDARNAHGQYVAIATLKTDTHPIERRVAFTLP